MHQLRIPSHEASTRSTDFASPAELLSKLSIFWFSLLSPKDQQDKIDQISNKLAAEDVNVGSPAAAAAGETKEDVRRKAFEMLFNEAPVVTRVDLFKEITKKFFDERRLCEGIPLSRQLGSNEQQEEIDEIKQSRYAEFYLGLSIIWFKARCASDPRNLIQVVVGKAGVDDHIFEKLVNETEEDFKLRRFTESFKQLQFSSQEDIVEFIQYAVVDDVSNTFEMSDVGVPGVSGNGFGMSDVDVSNTFQMREDVSNTGDSVSGNVAGITSRKRFCAGDSVSRLHADVPDFSGNGLEMSDVDVALADVSAHSIRRNAISDRRGAISIGFGIFRFASGRTSRGPSWEPLLEFYKMSTPDLRGPRGATATQGGGQGAITQGGQGTSEQ